MDALDASYRQACGDEEAFMEVGPAEDEMDSDAEHEDNDQNNNECMKLIEALQGEAQIMNQCDLSVDPGDLPDAKIIEDPIQEEIQRVCQPET